MDALHLTTAHNPHDTRIFDKQATSLVSAGFEVGILANNATTGSKNGVKFYSIGDSHSRAGRLRSIVGATRIARQIEPRIYHFHDPELIPTGVYLSLTTDSKVIYDVHENFGHAVSHREWIPDPLTPVLAKSIPFVERHAGRHIDAVIAATERIANRFETHVDRVEAIHNFPRTDSIPDQSERIEHDAEHVIGYVGGLVPVRGIYRMIDVIAALRERGVDIELWAAGHWTPDANRNDVEAYIADRGVGPYITFPGYLEYNNMFRHLYGTDVGLCLLDVESFQNDIPTKLFEYLYAGIPTVSTPLDAASRYIPDEYRHIVPQGDTEATADAVENALESDYDGKAMRALVEDRYSWKREAETLISLYEDLLQ